jgi:hypothetical protein
MKLSTQLVASGFLLTFLLGSCGRAETSKAVQAQNEKLGAVQEAQPNAAVFPEELLSTYWNWTPVLPEDSPFESDGHGGILVHSYLNPKAKESADRESPFPLLQGSMLAKAVVDNAETKPQLAKRVYFMKKMDDTFDPKNGNWAYAVANRKNGKLVFDANVKLKEQLCVSCHVKFKDFDNVKTVQIYKDGASELELPRQDSHPS